MGQEKGRDNVRIATGTGVVLGQGWDRVGRDTMAR